MEGTFGLAVKNLKTLRTHQLLNPKLNIRAFGPLPPPSATAPPKTKVLRNPFLPQLNPRTKRWAPPKYSLRRQADIVKRVKLAEAESGQPLTNLLPPGLKFIPSIPSTQTSGVTGSLSKSNWTKSVEWVGALPEKKPAVNLYANRKRMFKGHKWERVKATRDLKRKILMRDMPKRVRSYKAYYHKRKPNPLKPSGKVKAAKLPF